MEKPFAFKVENIEGDEVAIVPSLEKAIAAAKNDLKYGHSPNYITVTAYYEDGHTEEVDLSSWLYRDCRDVFGEKCLKYLLLLAFSSGGFRCLECPSSQCSSPFHSFHLPETAIEPLLKPFTPPKWESVAAITFMSLSTQQDT